MKAVYVYITLYLMEILNYLYPIQRSTLVRTENVGSRLFLTLKISDVG